MRPQLRGTAMVLISAACFGMMGIAAKLAYSEGANTIFVLAARFVIAAFILWIYSFATGKKEELKVTRNQAAVLFLLGGIIYTGVSIFYFKSINYIPVSLSSMVFYLYPVMVNALSIVIFKEKLNPKQVIALCIALTGSIVIMWAPGIYINWYGVLLAFLGAVSYAAYIMLLGSRLTEGMDSITTTTYIASSAALSFVVLGFLTNTPAIADLSVKGWGAILFIAIFSTVVAIITFYLGVKEVGASKASILSTFEPVVTVSLGVLVLGEVISFLQFAGAVMIICAVLIVNTAKSGYSTVSTRD